MTLDDLVIIDWLSPPTHANFDLAFIEALSGKFHTMYLYERLQGLYDRENVFILERPNARGRHALEVVNLVNVTLKARPILLLSYDPLYIPLLASSFSRILTYEHNTTPEKTAAKHILWQMLLLRKLRRLAQFPQQLERLIELDQNAGYLGSPLMQMPVVQSKSDPTRPVFLLPSVRSNQDALLPHLQHFQGCDIICKRPGANLIEAAVKAGARVHSRNRLEFHHRGGLVNGVILSLPASVRGSGWVNDAIGYGVPVISVTEAGSKLISRTFPDLDFVDLNQISSGPEFADALLRARAHDWKGLIDQNNLAIRNRLSKEVVGLNI